MALLGGFNGVGRALTRCSPPGVTVTATAVHGVACASLRTRDTQSAFMAGLGPGKAYAAASQAAHQSDFDKLKPLSVIRVKNGETVPLVSVFQVGHSCTVELKSIDLLMYVQCLLMLPSR